MFNFEKPEMWNFAYVPVIMLYMKISKSKTPTFLTYVDLLEETQENQH